MEKKDPSHPLKLLAFWQSFEFKDLFAPMFLGRSDIEVEIISGHRTRERSPHAPDYCRLYSLRQRIARGEFDLVLGSNIYRSPWPIQKKWPTRVAAALRHATYRLPWLDTWLMPWVLSPQGRRKTPVAIIDFRDNFFVYPWDFRLLRHSTCFFKRELFMEPTKSLLPLHITFGENQVKDHADKLRPFSWAYPQRLNGIGPGRPMHERDVDILMSGSSYPLRQHLIKRLKTWAHRHNHRPYNIVIQEGLLPFSEYQDLLQRSKIIICTESLACDNWRQYEAALSGAVPMISWPYTHSWNPFQPDVHALYFPFIGDAFERQLEEALQQTDRLAEIAQTARTFVLKQKAPQTLANYIINETLQTFHQNVTQH